jgi:uncharacterized iron-regulated membrane protein
MAALAAGVTVVALAVSGFLIYQNTRPIGEIVSVERQEWPLADGKTIAQRAEALIAIAAPEFRDELRQAARQLKYL